MHEVIEVFPCKATVLRQYYAQVSTLPRTLSLLIFFPLHRLNVKLGGVNAVPEPRDVTFLTDSANPTMVMGGHYPAA
jgi:hypothetical protein